MSKLWLRYVIVSTVILVLAVGIFFWNEARKEIIFLCGNFDKGVSELSVLRQLDTGSFLTYDTKETQEGKRIVVKSVYDLWMHQCVINIDTTGVVTESHLE